jgi:hypothetical protein
VEIFDPVVDPKSRRLVKKARRTNASRDKSERQHGFGVPSEIPIDCGLRTVITALACAIGKSDWDCVAEAYAMLQDIELKLREREERENRQASIPLPMNQEDAKRVLQNLLAHRASYRMQVCRFIHDGGPKALDFQSDDDFLDALYPRS